ncbi:LysM peptidoglycan-binding domain-containing protein [bacterium]|nr:LysM peptidoglycan-binding domain-containing protein [bacterium]
MSEERYEDEDYEEEDVENSAEDEYEDDAEASAEDAIDGTDEAASGEMEHVEWGFETKKPRFSREVVLGLVAVLGLVGIFGFVVYNQFSGDGDQVASTDDDGKTVPKGTLGAESDPKSATDPFAEGQPGDDDPNAAAPGSATLAQIGSDEPPLAGDLNAPLNDQFEPGLGGQTGAVGSADPFAAPASDSFESAEPGGSTGSGMNVASRDSIFGGPAGSGASASGFESQPAVDSLPGVSPFGSEPVVAGSLPEVDPLLSQNDSAGLGASDPFGAGGSLGASQPAAMLPEGDLLSGSPSPGTGALSSESFGSEPFGSQAAAGSGATSIGERPRGLFDSELAGNRKPTKDARPARDTLAGGQRDAFDSGLSSSDSLGQSGNLNAPLPDGSGFASEPAAGSLPLSSNSLPTVAGDGGLSGSGPFGQPVGGNRDSESGSPQLGNDSLMTDSPSSPARLGNDLLPADAGPGALSSEPFGSEPADGFKAPVVADQNDPFGRSGLSSSGRSGLSSPSVFDSPSGFESATGSATTVRSGSSQRSDAGAATLDDSIYTVEESDSFWSISRKVYGTSKYFEALQRYNRSKVDDPKKLKPGMVLDTPSPSILADYLDGGTPASPQAIADGGRSRSGLPTAASSLPVTAGTNRSEGNPAGLSGDILPIEPAGDSEAVQTVASAPTNTTIGDSQKAGFFIGNQGYPMYRVASGDTLTAIAADHLGRASRWKQIYRMNQAALKSPNELAPGLVLKLPGDASRVPLIDRTSSLR